jgi:hypothetical protein
MAVKNVQNNLLVYLSKKFLCFKSAILSVIPALGFQLSLEVALVSNGMCNLIQATGPYLNPVWMVAPTLNYYRIGFRTVYRRMSHRGPRLGVPRLP